MWIDATFLPALMGVTELDCLRRSNRSAISSGNAETVCANCTGMKALLYNAEFDNIAAEVQTCADNEASVSVSGTASIVRLTKLINPYCTLPTATTCNHQPMKCGM